MSAAAAPRTLLGTLMCRAGLISEAQLEHALAVQGESGRPLGEVIVRLGYASPGAVANALAEQHRETLPTDYGVSTGLDGAVRAEQAAAAGAAPAGAAQAEAAKLQARVAELQAQLAAASESKDEAEMLRGRVGELEAALAATREPTRPPEEEHLLFVPSPAGYSIARRPGPCPERGSRVELNGRPYTVARSGGSPLGNRLRCAYLEPAP